VSVTGVPVLLQASSKRRRPSYCARGGLVSRRMFSSSLRVCSISRRTAPISQRKSSIERVICWVSSRKSPRVIDTSCYPAERSRHPVCRHDGNEGSEHLAP